MSNTDPAPTLNSAVWHLLQLDADAVAALVTPNDLAITQGDPLAALTALLPAVRAAAHAVGYPALEAEQRCDALRAACIEEQRCAVDYLAARWAGSRCQPGETEDCATRWGESIVGVKQALDRVMSMLALAPAGADRQQQKRVPADGGNSLELIPGGFAYKGKDHDLIGRPRDMLEALVKSPHRRYTAVGLRKALRVDDEAVTYPEQVVKDTATELRLHLRNAVADAGLTCADPLPSLGKGKDLTYKLDLP
jgi:hypothetical protein